MTSGPALLVLALLVPGAARQAGAQPFAFPLPWDDSAHTVVDVSALNPAPIDAKRRIEVRDDHFYDQTGRRVRFLATNLTAGDCFPTHDVAEKTAARMHKLGINMVRLHHMDAPWAKPNIFYLQDGSYGKRTDALDPQSLDRLDYLLYQFKQNGIYVDLNLHVTRQWNAEMGFPDADKIDQQGKVVAYFEPRAIDLQKQYARQVLTHRNPYTKTRYTDEPTVAVMEIDNEDSLLGAADSLGALPPHYRSLIFEGWNSFLSRKYGSTEALRQAWQSDAKPLGASLIANGRMEQGTEGWSFERQGGTQMESAVENPAPQAGAPEGKALHLTGLKPDGTDWHLQVHYAGLDVKDGDIYTVTFAARAASPRTLGVNVRYDRAPWTIIGLDTAVSLTTEWKRFTLSFTAHDPDPNHNRLSFVLGSSPADVFLGDAALRPGGGGVELQPGWTVEARTVDLPGVNTSPAGRDYVEYLIGVEAAYSQGIRRFVQQTLHAAKPIICSQASYGGIGGVWRESRMDWVDMHAYWQHPSFPGEPFDPNNYRIGNTAMVKDSGAGTLAGLAMHRVAGRPFTVSEYDHPAPSEFAAEDVPVIFSYAAWQDWDGIFLFCYSGGPGDHIRGFFDTSDDPAKMAFLPAMAQAFLRGGLAPCPSTMVLTVPEKQVAALKSRGTDYAFWQAASQPGGWRVAPRDFVDHRASIVFSETADKPSVEATNAQSSAGKLGWDHDAGIFQAVSPYAKVLAGFAGGRKVDLGGVTVDGAQAAGGFFSLALTSMDGKALEESSSLLLTALAKAHNPGLQWNAERTFAANAWGQGPVQVEGVDAIVTVSIPSGKAAVWALDNKGARTKAVPLQQKNGKLTFRISPEYKAVWYEVAVTR